MNQQYSIYEELPRTSEQLIARRKLKNPLRSLNDTVDEFHVRLWEKDDYQRYFDAIYDEQAIEGSCSADNLKAAEMIRESARDAENKFLGNQKLATIVKALKVVKRRYGISRKERREVIGGERVPNDRNSNDSE